METISTGKGEPMVEMQLTKRFGRSTKHFGSSTKHFGSSTKHFGSSTKGLTEMMMEEYWESGADGDYTVTTTGGNRMTVSGAIAIRVLDHGELNLLTDAGRWYLFAPNTWLTVFPTQPEPGNSVGK